MAESKSRVALVTGGMGGLGEAICIKLAALGDKVVTTHSPGNTKADEWLANMKRQGFSFTAYPCDVADWESSAACVKKVSEAIGPIDVLVNNAGITRDMTFKKMDKANWDMVLKTNLDSCFNMTKQVCDGMAERGWGRIVNVCSSSGKRPSLSNAAYSVTKAAQLSLSRVFADAYAARGVLVNAVTPGPVDTPLWLEEGGLADQAAERGGVTREQALEAARKKIPLGRFGSEDEVAAVVAFLCSEQASNVTGAAWSVDGGSVPVII